MSNHQITMVWETPTGDKTETLVLELSAAVPHEKVDYIFGMMADTIQAYAIDQGFDSAAWESV